jgi:hypothetical protein
MHREVALDEPGRRRWVVRERGGRVVRGAASLVAVLALVATVPGPADAGEPPERPRRWAADPDISERSGSSGAGWFRAWTSNSEDRPDRYNAYLRETDSGIRWRLNARGTQAEFGNFLGWELTFSQRRPGRPADLFVGNAFGPFRVPLPPKVNTAASELDPTLSGPWLLFTRYQARAKRHRVMLFNRETRTLDTLASTRGATRLRAGQVRGDYATWYTWGPDRSNVFRHRISTGRTVRLARPARFVRQYGSSVGADGTVYYHRRMRHPCRRGATELIMHPRGGPAEVMYSYPARRTGERTVLNPPTYSSNLVFTVRKCRLPERRATDLYYIPVPENPRP